MKNLPDFIQFKSFPGTPLKDIFTAANDDLLYLLDKLLQLDPLKRCSATEVCLFVLGLEILLENLLKIGELYKVQN